MLSPRLAETEDRRSDDQVLAETPGVCATQDLERPVRRVVGPPQDRSGPLADFAFAQLHGQSGTKARVDLFLGQTPSLTIRFGPQRQRVQAPLNQAFDGQRPAFRPQPPFLLRTPLRRDAGAKSRHVWIGAEADLGEHDLASSRAAASVYALPRMPSLL